MPYIVIVVDEMSDLKQAAPKDFEGFDYSIGSKRSCSRACIWLLRLKVHEKMLLLVLSKLTFLPKLHFLYRTSWKVRIILDQNGAEKLLGQW